MNKDKLLTDYMKQIYASMDKIREHYPKAMSKEIIDMEKGYRLCITDSSKWIEEVLNLMELKTIMDTSTQQHPVSRLVDTTTGITNSLSVPAPLKKKSFLQVASEASKDMAGDFFKAAQLELPKEKK